MKQNTKENLYSGLNCFATWSSPKKCHPELMKIKDWDKKIIWPFPEAARLRRKMIKKGIKLSLPRPITNSSKNWSEYEFILNGALSNMGKPGISTYNTLPIYNEKTKRHTDNPEINEIYKNPSLLKFTCSNGKVKKTDY